MNETQKMDAAALRFAKKLMDDPFEGEKDQGDVLKLAKKLRCYKEIWSARAWLRALWGAPSICELLHRRITTRHGKSVQLYFCSRLQLDEDSEESEEDAPSALESLIAELKEMSPYKSFTDRSSKCPLTLRIRVFFAEAFRVFGGTDKDCVAIVATVRGKEALFSYLVGTVTSVNELPDTGREGVLRGLRGDGFSLPVLKKAGFTAGRDICSQQTNTSNKGGRPTVCTEENVDLMRNVFDNDSTPLSQTSKKMSKKYGTLVQSAALHKKKAHLFRVHQLPMKRSSFYAASKKLFSNYIFRKRKTDFCEYCFKEDSIRSSIQHLFASRSLQCPQMKAHSQDIVEHLHANKINLNTGYAEFEETVSVHVEDLKQLEFHKLRAQTQRDAYHRDIQDPSSSLVIEIDFKQKGSLPMLPVETSGIFYSRRTYSHFGVGLYWKAGNEVKQHNYDFVMDNLQQNSHSAIRCLLHLFKARTSIPKHDALIVWADVGRHFQSKEMLHFLLFKLSSKPVTVNFFCEKHGKNGRDSHFGVVSKHLSDASCTTEINTVADVALHLNNINNTTGVEMKFKESSTYTVHTFDCTLLTAPFCWRKLSRSATVYASKLSHPQNFIEVSYNISSEKITHKPKRAPEIQESSDAYVSLASRQDRMERFFP